MRFPRRLGLRCVVAVVCVSLVSGSLVQRAHAGPNVYVVRQGDTLSHIAQAFGTTVNALLAANNLNNANRIFVGETLVIGSTAASSLAAAPASASTNSATYIVQSGDTLSTIGQRYGLSVGALATANQLNNPSSIVVGQQLVIPSVGSANAPTSSTTQAGLVFPNTSVYVVQAGDTLSAISQRFGVDATVLASTNQISDPATLQIGQQLAIPAAGSAPATTSVAAATSTSGTVYAVQAGDTLSLISQRYGVSLASLIGANGIQEQSILSVGQQLTIPSVSTTETPVGSVAIGAILTSEAQAAGVDVALVKALAWQESGWRMVTASDGGVGVMQLMPDSVTWVSSTFLGYQVNPYDPTQNVRAGVAMLHYYLGLFGDTRLALAAYHQGLTSVETQGLLPETEGYVANVLALQQQFAG